MRIEIWSDVVCPWCYIGKRRLESALAEFAPAAAGEVEIVWRSFQLDPTAPTEPTETVAQALGRKYGGGESAGAAMVSQVEAVAAQEGLAFDHHNSLHVGTVDAHRLLHLALSDGGPQLQGALKESLLEAYFVKARNVADHTVLTELAVAAGLSTERVQQVLDSQEFAAEVDADIAQARAYGANGVPFYVIDGRYGISGAQPSEAFTQVLNRAWSDAHPALTMVDGDEVCGPDGCAVPATDPR